METRYVESHDCKIPVLSGPGAMPNKPNETRPGCGRGGRGIPDLGSRAGARDEPAHMVKPAADAQRPAEAAGKAR